MASAEPKSYMTGKDMLLLPDGSTYHLGVKKGDLYPLIVTVGSPGRAEAMSKSLDVVEKTIRSSRQFHVFSGKFKGVGVSIIAIGMGAPMMDFMLREASYVIEGPMAVIRVGTCGLFQPQHLPGTVVVCGKGCSGCSVNNANFTGGALNCENVPKENYILTKPIKGNPDITEALIRELKARDVTTVDGTNIAGDFFYSTQGRTDGHFDDLDNKGLVALFVGNGFDTVEMETFNLFLCGQQRRVAPLYVTACHIGLLNRVNPEITENVSADKLHELEKITGEAAMESLINFDLETGKNKTKN